MCGIVLLVGKEPEVRENVLDFLAVPEARAPENNRRNAHVVERLLYHAGLRVGAVENRRLREVAHARGADVFCNLLRLGAVIHHVSHANRVARLFLGEHVLLHFDRADVMRDYGTRALHDVARGAVVAFEFHDGHRGEVAVEVADNLDVRATPAVNTLVVVAHHGYVLVFVYQELQQFVLHVVRILVFVDKHVAEGFHKRTSHIRNFLQHQHHIE